MSDPTGVPSDTHTSLPPDESDFLARRAREKAEVERFAGNFTTEAPVAAAALVAFALDHSVDAVAARVRDVLADPDWRPAAGWMRFIPACLWADGPFPAPPRPADDPDWPDRKGVYVGDRHRLEHLLWGRFTDPTLDDLFPRLGGDLTPPAAGRTDDQTNPGDAAPSPAAEIWSEGDSSDVAADPGADEVFAGTPADALRRLAGHVAAAATTARELRRGDAGDPGGCEAVKADHWARARDLCDRYALPAPPEPDVGTPAQLRNALADLERWCRDEADRMGQAAAPAGGATADAPAGGPGTAPSPPTRSKGVTRAEAEVRVRDWLFSWAAERKLLTENPLSGMKNPKPPPRQRAITEAEFWQMYENAGGPLRGHLLALYLSGARPKEVRELRWENVRDDRWVLPEHKTAKKTGRPRHIYLDATVREMMGRLKGNGHTHVFLNTEGQPWTRNALRLQVWRIKKKLGMASDVCAYLCRHGFGIHWAVIVAALCPTSCSSRSAAFRTSACKITSCGKFSP